MDPILSLALNSIKADRTARKNVRPGKYDVDELVHVTGSVTVGADYLTTPTVSIPVKEVLAFVLAEAGLTKDAAVELLRNAIHDAIASKGKAQGEIAGHIKAVKETMKEVQNELLADLPPQHRNGKVTADLNVEAVEVGLADAA